MKPAMFLIMPLLLAAMNTYAQPEPDPAAEAFYNKAMPVINKKHVAWIKQTAKNVNEKKWEEGAIRKQAQQYAGSSSLGQMDIEALVFLVLMEASKSSQEDLKSIMAKVKNINQQKETLRSSMNRLKDTRQPALTRLQLDSLKQLSANTGNNRQLQSKTIQKTRAGTDAARQPATKAEIDATVGKMKSDLDSANELGEEQMLKMQMTTDRMNKMKSTLSNLLKKISDTANQITQNLK